MADFVLSATVSDRITPGLAEHLVAGGAQLLEQCVVRGLFLTGPASVGAETSYRWNPLFAAHCRSVAARRSPGMPAALHRKAAHYLHRREAGRRLRPRRPGRGPPPRHPDLGGRLARHAGPGRHGSHPGDVPPAASPARPPRLRSALPLPPRAPSRVPLSWHLPAADSSTRDDARERHRLMLALVRVLLAGGPVGADRAGADRDGLLAQGQHRPPSDAGGGAVRRRPGPAAPAARRSAGHGPARRRHPMRSRRRTARHRDRLPRRAEPRAAAAGRRARSRRARRFGHQPGIPARLGTGGGPVDGIPGPRARRPLARPPHRGASPSSRHAVDIAGARHTPRSVATPRCAWRWSQLAHGDLAQARRTQARDDVLHADRAYRPPNGRTCGTSCGA